MGASNGNASNSTSMRGRAEHIGVGAALLIARIGVVILWLAAAVSVVTLMAYIIMPGSFHANYGVVELNVGDAFALSVRGSILDVAVYLQEHYTAGAPLVQAVIASCVTNAIVYALLAIAFGEIAALCARLRDWKDGTSGLTPFRTTVSERMSRAGWCLIAAPAAALLDWLFCTIFAKGGSWNLWMSGLLVMTGIILLMIARIFEYGMTLEQEVDGLL
ncbi:hypothetical protein D2E25_1033 [Bifidobacterium goeldii]|uniref:DUF2975 domain-containing protein n=1 Tax=Bifidobacterium goeldii TaxID=2306975 RepID=A0A430FJT3_9BIFI|nr:hypothetical protein [Bifidobacterium goeldii]RSX53060.1 hypothetical protein D2E25_1033 [Bifidobacterium goeldii]